jgi:hypothetical protein
MATVCRNMAGYNLERTNKIHYFLEHLLAILQRYNLCGQNAEEIGYNK